MASVKFEGKVQTKTHFLNSDVSHPYLAFTFSNQSWLLLLIPSPGRSEVRASWNWQSSSVPLKDSWSGQLNVTLGRTVSSDITPHHQKQTHKINHFRITSKNIFTETSRCQGLKIDSSCALFPVPSGPENETHPCCDSFNMKPISWYKPTGVVLFKYDQ